MATWIQKWKVRGGHGVYTVALADNGEWGCSCPGWKFHPDRGYCKHIQAFTELHKFLGKKPSTGQLRDIDGNLLFEWSKDVFRVAELITDTLSGAWIWMLDRSAFWSNLPSEAAAEIGNDRLLWFKWR